METLPYEPQAAAGEPMPDLPYADQVTYLALRYVYAVLRNHAIDRETAMNEKRRIIDDLRVWKYQAEMGEHWVQLIKSTEAARTEYRKNRTLENADKLVEVMECLR